MAGSHMQPYFEHPTEEELERFLLKHSQEDELETVETHIMACHACVSRLEAMELDIAAIKASLGETRQKPYVQPAKAGAEKAGFEWRRWFALPALSWAAAAAAAVLCVAAFLPAQLSLSAYRGTETTVAPEWRPLNVQLNAADLADGTVAVQLVNEDGAELWTAPAAVRRGQVEVHLPRLHPAGSYFVRLYAIAEGGGRGDLLREFPFQVK